MKRIINNLVIITSLMVFTFSFLPIKTNAATYTGQQVTCYQANATSEFPARPGYKYVLGVVAASQYKVKADFSSGPRIPFGTIVTLSQTVHFPSSYSFLDTNKFRIDDMGDKYQTRTPYFVDVYYGSRSEPFTTGCKNFGTKTMSVSF